MARTDKYAGTGISALVTLYTLASMVFWGIATFTFQDFNFAFSQALVGLTDSIVISLAGGIALAFPLFIYALADSQPFSYDDRQGKITLGIVGMTGLMIISPEFMSLFTGNVLIKTGLFAAQVIAMGLVGSNRLSTADKAGGKK